MTDTPKQTKMSKVAWMEHLKGHSLTQLKDRLEKIREAGKQGWRLTSEAKALDSLIEMREMKPPTEEALIDERPVPRGEFYAHMCYGLAQFGGAAQFSPKGMPELLDQLSTARRAYLVSLECHEEASEEVERVARLKEMVQNDAQYKSRGGYGGPGTDELRVAAQRAAQASGAPQAVHSANTGDVHPSNAVEEAFFAEAEA